MYESLCVTLQSDRVYDVTMMDVGVAACMSQCVSQRPSDRVYDVTMMDVGVASCMSHCVSQ